MHGSPLRNVMLLLGLASVLIGCSMDKYAFVSTVDKPMSVALVDHHRDKTLWEMDIPVQHKLVLDFDRPLEFEPLRANMEPATKMSWRLYNLRPKLGRHLPIEWHRRDLPGMPFMIKVTLRPAPEFPPDMQPIETPPPVTMQTLSTETDTRPSTTGPDTAPETVVPDLPADEVKTPPGEDGAEFMEAIEVQPEAESNPDEGAEQGQ